MARLIVSFCYTRPLNYVLALVDADSDAFEWIDLSGLALPIWGATGLCRVDTSYYAALQVKQGEAIGTVLIELDEAARVTRATALEGVVDAHSLLAWRGELLIVASATNQVFAIDWPRGAKARIRLFFEREPGEDTLHMNSIQAFENRIYLSMFGPRIDGSWRDASNGQILDLTSGGTPVASGLAHPHALFVDGDALFCLSSRDGRLVQVAGSPRPTVAAPPGYLRGAIACEGRLYVGVSVARTHSKSRGTANRGVSRASMSGLQEGSGRGCGVHVLEPKAGARSWIDLSPFGAELYDIAPWPGREIAGTRVDAMAQRLHAVNREIGEMIGAWTQIERYHGMIERLAREMTPTPSRYGDAAARHLGERRETERALRGTNGVGTLV